MTLYLAPLLHIVAAQTWYVQPQWNGSVLNLYDPGKSDCRGLGLDAVFTDTLFVSEKKDTPPVITTVQTYFNPCTPIHPKSGCPDDSLLCTIESFEHKGEIIVTDVESVTTTANVSLWSRPFGRQRFFVIDKETEGAGSYIHHLEFIQDTPETDEYDTFSTFSIQLMCNETAVEPVLESFAGFHGLHIEIEMAAICEWERQHLPSIDDYIREEARLRSEWHDQHFAHYSLADEAPQQQAWILAAMGSAAIVLAVASFWRFKKLRQRKRGVV